MNNQICQCGHEFSRDEHTYCPACGSFAGEESSAHATCEYKTKTRSANTASAVDESAGHGTSLAETDAVKKTEAEIRKVVIKPS
jgi:hypothetical protein